MTTEKKRSRWTARAPDGQVLAASTSTGLIGQIEDWEKAREEARAAIDRFPGIRRVALEIAYDNGMINRGMDEGAWLLRLNGVMNTETPDDLGTLDAWCRTLNDEDVTILACGEYAGPDSPRTKLEARCPGEGLCEVFERIFEEG